MNRWRGDILGCSPAFYLMFYLMKESGRIVMTRLFERKKLACLGLALLFAVFSAAPLWAGKT